MAGVAVELAAVVLPQVGRRVRPTLPGLVERRRMEPQEVLESTTIPAIPAVQVHTALEEQVGLAPLAGLQVMEALVVGVLSGTPLMARVGVEAEPVVRMVGVQTLPVALEVIMEGEVEERVGPILVVHRGEETALLASSS